MKFFNEFVFYLGLAGTSIATFILILIQLNKDSTDSRTKHYAIGTAIFSAILILISIFTGVNAHLDANNQADSVFVYHRLYDSLLHSNLDSSHKSIDSTRKVISTTDSILNRSITIITEQNRLLLFEDSTRKQLNNQIVASKNALAKATSDIINFQTGKGSFLYLKYTHGYDIKTGYVNKDTMGMLIMVGKGNNPIDSIKVSVLDMRTSKDMKLYHSFAFTPMYFQIDRISNPQHLTETFPFNLFSKQQIRMDSTRDYNFMVKISSTKKITVEFIKVKYVKGSWESAIQVLEDEFTKPFEEYSKSYPQKNIQEFEDFQ